MSMYFDIAINCDLREDTPEDIIKAIQCLTQKDYVLQTKPNLIYKDFGHDYENIWDIFYDYHFLMHDPEHNVISNFRRVHRLTIPLEKNREVHRYRLQYCADGVHDDFFYAHHMPFVYWLASIAYETYFGYYVGSENQGLGIHHFMVKDGKLIDQ